MLSLTVPPQMFHGGSKSARTAQLREVQRNGGVCLTTYGMVVSSVDLLNGPDDMDDFFWDFIVLDEGTVWWGNKMSHIAIRS